MAVTRGGASTNRKLFSMHSEMVDEKDINPDVDLTYRVRNMFSPDRFVYFLSDSPHLIKQHVTTEQIQEQEGAVDLCGMTAVLYYFILLLTLKKCFMMIKIMVYICFQS